LRVIDEIFSSTTRFIANDKALNDNWKKEKMKKYDNAFKSGACDRGNDRLKDKDSA
jgi:hypothetical protein